MPTREGQYVHYTDQEVADFSRQVGYRIREFAEQDGEEVATIVYMPRGGLLVAQYVSHILRLGAGDLEAMSIYSYDNAHHHHDLQFGQMPRPEKIKGNTVAVVDEMCDRGHTLKRAVKDLGEMGAKRVISGVIDIKVGSLFTPNVVINEWSRQDWVVYPWEEPDTREPVTTMSSTNSKT